MVTVSLEAVGTGGMGVQHGLMTSCRAPLRNRKPQLWSLPNCETVAVLPGLHPDRTLMNHKLSDTVVCGARLVHGGAVSHPPAAPCRVNASAPLVRRR